MISTLFLPKATGFGKKVLRRLEARVNQDNSTDQYALSKNDVHDWYFWLDIFWRNKGLLLGFSGLRISAMLACRGVRPPFLTLQETHAHTMFSHVVAPP
jgi:hypothetical protein